ncbi:MAG: DNA primase [Clostridia bacterium]|nr:DNA primase [Clostridia bacterium]
MAQRLSDDFLRLVREKNDIESTIAPYVSLRRSGRNLVGLCPFHGEKTPSFTVYTDQQHYYCYGCGAGGDVITFTKNIQNLSFYDAVKVLAERAGLRMPENYADDGMDKLRRRCLAANREAARFFYECLKSEKGREGLQYLRSRGLDASIISHFGLGFAPNEWDSLKKHLNEKGFRNDELEQFNLVRKSQRGTYYDAFRNRVMFPIINLQGDVIAFGGRVMDDSKPKYLNSSDTVAFRKRQGLFALNFAKNSSEKTLILCEGYMDVISLHRFGFTNAVAGLGTALTEEQANLISRYAEEVYICYDADEAGQKAARRAIESLGKVNVKIKVIRLSGGKDPDEILNKNGVEYMRRLLSGAMNDTEFRLTGAKKGLDLSVNNDKVVYTNAAAEILASIPNPVQRDVYLSAVAEDAGVSRDALSAQVERIRRKKKTKEDHARFDRIVKETVGTTRTPIYPEGVSGGRKNAEERLLSCLLRNPDFCRQVSGEIGPQDFASPLNAKIYSVILEKSETSSPADVHTFSQMLADEEIGYVSYLDASDRVLANTVAECLDCIAKIKSDDSGAQEEDPGKWDNEEFLKQIERIRNEKK